MNIGDDSSFGDGPCCSAQEQGQASGRSWFSRLRRQPSLGKRESHSSTSTSATSRGGGRDASKIQSTLPKPLLLPQGSLPPKHSVQGSSMRLAENRPASKKVSIDDETRVPLDLYVGLMKAAEQAKSRGQHRVKEATESTNCWPSSGSTCDGSPRTSGSTSSAYCATSSRSLVLSELPFD